MYAQLTRCFSAVAELLVYIVIGYIMFVVHGRISVLGLNDLFVQLGSYSFVTCDVEIFEQIKMDG